MLSDLPDKLLTYVFEFLEIEDCASLLRVSKRFSAIIEEHNKFWTRECFRQYISFDLELYCEVYADEEYKTCIKQRTFAIPKNIWKNLLTTGRETKKNFSGVLRQLVSKESAENFLENFDEVLRQPPLPALKLKRETQTCDTQTIFQSRLSELLYEEEPTNGKRFKFIDENKSVIDELLNIKNEISYQLNFADKDEIMKARWYLFENKESNSKILDANEEDDDYILELMTLNKLDKAPSTINGHANAPDTEKNTQSLLLELYNCLYNSVHHFCTVQFEYLDSIENVYDLLAEYTTRWNTYVCSMFELERLFESFTKLMNENYESLFEGYPAFPKFSIWRMMTKIWMKEIFEKDNFKLILNESFLRVLSNHREKNIKQFLNTNIVNINFSDGGKYAELPKNLYVGLNAKRKKNSSIRYQSYEKLNNIHHACFGDVMDLEKRLLYNFIQSILDISLNEIKIHYISCSDIATNYPYHELEECFLGKSDEFYSDHQHLFNDNPDYFCHFLKSDFELLSEVLTERTNTKLQNIQTQNGLIFMKSFMTHVIKKSTPSHFESVTTQITAFEDQDKDLDEFIISATKSVIEEIITEDQKPFNFYRLPSIDFEEEEEGACTEKKGLMNLCSQFKENKQFIRKLITFFGAINTEFKANFSYLKKQIDHFEKVKITDSIIKESNMSKNIPYEMGDVDCLFYDIEKDIRLDLLSKLYQDYMEFVKQQEQENENKDSMEQEMNDNTRNGLINGHFDPLAGGIAHDFSNIDLMQLTDAQLGRSTY